MENKEEELYTVDKETLIKLLIEERDSCYEWVILSKEWLDEDNKELKKFNFNGVVIVKKKCLTGKR